MIALLTICLQVSSSAVDRPPEQFSTAPLSIVEPWTIEIPPLGIPSPTGHHVIRESVRIAVPPVAGVEVRDEEHATLPLFDPNAGGWRKGARLRSLVTVECSATGLLDPATVVVKSSPDSPSSYVLDKDYAMDGFWGTLGRIEGGSIPSDGVVFIDYTYWPCRLDTIAVNKDGTVRVIPGKPGIGVLLPPDLAPDEVRIANVWLQGRTEGLTDANLYPIHFGDEAREAAQAPVAETLLPKTLAKLRAGEPLTIVAWGDSVTNGGGVEHDQNLWYQHQFARLLKERFPNAAIEMRTAAWPGGNSRTYLDAPPESERNFQRDVLDPKPDLITIEFVNDSYLDEEATQAHYAGILLTLQGIGAEVILITPHFVRPDWMGMGTSMKFDDDPRPYVKGLRRFARENNVALADASLEWGRLWRQGIPYITLETNSINHPDARGHAIFAEALIGLFPEK